MDDQAILTGHAVQGHRNRSSVGRGGIIALPFSYKVKPLDGVLLGPKESMDTVLVVEDSRPMQRTLQRLFESDGFAVQIASDGVAGLESFRKHSPTVVVLDLKLPLMPGKEVCRAFKAHAAQARSVRH